ncbi:hypothetical protein ACS0TY_017968 [Phlomoides rotata]
MNFKPKGWLSARDWGNDLFMFSFELVSDRDWVLQNQPWHFDGFLFAIKEMAGHEQPSAIKLSTAEF